MPLYRNLAPDSKKWRGGSSLHSGKLSPMWPPATAPPSSALGNLSLLSASSCMGSMLLSLVVEKRASLRLAMLERAGCSSQPVHTRENDTMSSLVYVSSGAPVLGSVLREPSISS